MEHVYRCASCGALEAYGTSQGYYLVDWAEVGRRFAERHRACRREDDGD